MSRKSTGKVCEICGTPGYLTPVKIEGAVVLACRRCGRFGTPVESPRTKQNMKASLPQQSRTSTSTKPRQVASAPRRRERVLVEDYGRKLRDAMASQGISRKDFAQRIGERENLVARIESQKIIPEMKVIQKIERELEISLTEEPEEVKISDFVSSSSATTLGSVARIKRKKKTET